MHFFQISDLAILEHVIRGLVHGIPWFGQLYTEPVHRASTQGQYTEPVHRASTQSQYTEPVYTEPVHTPQASCVVVVALARAFQNWGRFACWPENTKIVNSLCIIFKVWIFLGTCKSATCICERFASGPRADPHSETNAAPPSRRVKGCTFHVDYWEPGARGDEAGVGVVFDRAVSRNFNHRPTHGPAICVECNSVVDP